MLSRTTLFSRFLAKTASAAAALCVASFSAGTAQADLVTDGTSVYTTENGTVAKYDENGRLLWSVKGSTEWVHALAVGPAGNLYVGGDSGINSHKKTDGFIRKYSPQGAVLWSRAIGTPEVDDGVTSLATDTSGNLYVLGGTRKPKAEGGDNDPFVRKYSPAGTLLWTTKLRTPDEDVTFGAATDSQGNVFIGVISRWFVPWRSEVPPVPEHDPYIVLIKLDKNGGKLWRKQLQFGANTFDQGDGLVVDSTGAAIVVGSTYVSDEERWEIFMHKYSSDGTVLKAEQFPAAKKVREFASTVALDSSDNLYTAGNTTDCIKGPPGRSCNTFTDALVRKYSNAGDVVWTRQVANIWADRGTGIAVPTSDKIFVTFTLGTAPAHRKRLLRRLDAEGKPVWTKEIKPAQ